MKKRFKIFTSLTMIVSFSIMMIMPISAANVEEYSVSLEWDDIETINNHLDNNPMLPSTIPNSVDLTSNFPTPRHQGGLGSCTAWAVGYALKSSQEYNKRGWTKDTDTHNFSPSFIFNKTTLGSGISISTAMNLVKNTGVCSLKYFAYDGTDYSTMPTSKEIAAAGLYKSSYWGTIKGVTAIKNHLACGDGVVVGVEVYPDFENISSSNPVYDNCVGNSRGGHAICLIGYDNSIGAFKFINSWGTDWGLDGYGWISYDLINNINVNYYGIPVGYVMAPATDDYYLGDINDDGAINASDSLLVLQHAAKIITLTDRQCALADVNGDTLINSADSNAILEYAARSIDHLPLYD